MANDMADVLHDAYAEYCDGRVDWQKMVVAVHSFLGAEKPLKRGAVGEALQDIERALHAGSYNVLDRKSQLESSLQYVAAILRGDEGVEDGE